ncbi:MAG: DNA-deoxyinosine glycosylase [Pyramidobacter sp.]|jgi:TDG/mug DNA glycosylase family protein
MVVIHPLEPVFNASSRVLLLGTMPSPASRETGFYYGHRQNRFWRVLSALFHEDVPSGNGAKKDFILSHKLALWDVLRCCEIQGASDSSIKNPQPNDLTSVLENAPIQAIFCTGKKSWSLYCRLIERKIHRPALCLPSTSPANCAVSFEELCKAYRRILPFLENPRRQVAEIGEKSSPCR